MSTALGITAPTADQFTNPVGTAERVAATFLVRHSGHTLESYTRALRVWAQWCIDHDLAILEARREHVELWTREMEASGLSPATRAQRLAAVAGFYSAAVDEAVIASNPVARVRRPKLAGESQRLGVDKAEGIALLAAAEASGPRDHLLACLLLLNGLRVSEALSLDIEALTIVRGHHVVRVLGKGGRYRDVVLAPRTVAALQAWLQGRTTGAVFLTATGARMDRQAASKVIRRLARTAGVEHIVSPHSLRHGFVTSALDAGVALHHVQDAAGHADPRTTRRYDRARNALDKHAAYAVASYFA